MTDLKNHNKVLRILKQIGLVDGTKISDTLQGSIWRACLDSAHNVTSAIKITSSFLHEHNICMSGDTLYHVNEDILLEQSILRYLTEQQNCPRSIVKFQRFIETDENLVLVMEDGGTSLFDWLVVTHKLIKAGKIEVEHWKQVTKIIFKQMIECIEYIHSKNVCHFDISLENFLINDVQIEIVKYKNQQHKVRFVTDGIQIKLCDFGLAQLFTKAECLSSKHCGKLLYKSPEVISKKRGFDAKLNDIWGLGCCLFIISTGHILWNIADETDNTFVRIMKGYRLFNILQTRKHLHYVDDSLLNLLQSMFKYENERINLRQIKNHPWVQCR